MASEEPTDEIPASDDILALTQKWAQNPQAIFKWRTDTFHLILATLKRDYIATKPPGSNGYANQLAAMKMMIQLGEALEKIRPEVPHKCPDCGATFHE